MKRVLIYGDSNTYGYDPGDFFGGRYPGNERWTTILQEKLKDSYELIVDGMNGRQIPDMSRNQGYLEQLIHENQPLDLFAFMLGTNDILMTNPPDASVPAAKMDRFLDWLKEQNAASQILVIAPPYIGENRDAYLKACHKESRTMNQIFEKTAADHQVLFVDVGLWNIGLAWDQVHLSRQGCASFAERLGEYLSGNQEQGKEETR